MAKQYYEWYEEIKSLTPRTKQYYVAVSKMFKLKIDRPLLNKIANQRKNRLYNKGLTFSEAVKAFENDVRYENATIERAYKIWSGEYFETRVNTLADNYIKALEKNNIDEDIIKFLRNNMEIVKMGALPPISEFYVPSKGKGKKYSLNLEGSEQWNQDIREFLEDAWGMPKKEV